MNDLQSNSTRATRYNAKDSSETARVLFVIQPGLRGYIEEEAEFSNGVLPIQE